MTSLVNPCINPRVETYLLTGKVDAKDVKCAPHATPVAAGSGRREVARHGPGRRARAA